MSAILAGLGVLGTLAFISWMLTTPEGCLFVASSEWSTIFTITCPLN